MPLGQGHRFLGRVRDPQILVPAVVPVDADHPVIRVVDEVGATVAVAAGFDEELGPPSRVMVPAP
jgi:hypothetical protein